MASFECIFTSDGTGQLWNSCAWDIVSGSVLAQYKGGISRARTLCLLGSDYVISAQQDKPLLRVWSLQRRDQVQKQIVCPGVVSALATSPDGLHCVAGIAEKIYLWQVPSGDLLAVLSCHFNLVTCLCFSDDGGLFVSASSDGQVLVWDLAEAACSTTQGPAEPMHAWSQHSYNVTDIHLGVGRSRCYTCSADQTCRVFSLDSGELLATVVLDAALTAIVTDPAEDHIFAGASTGNIFEVGLYKLNTGNKRSDAMFVGHNVKVTCLAVSLDGQLLVSGSEDCTARVWDVASKQCIHTLHHKGAVNNVLVVLTPLALTSMQPIPPRLPLGIFKRTTQATKDESGVPVLLDSGLVTECQYKMLQGALPPADYAELLSMPSAAGAGEAEDEGEEAGFRQDQDLSKQVALLRKVNKQLYSYSCHYILKQHGTGSDMSSM